MQQPVAFEAIALERRLGGSFLKWFAITAGGTLSISGIAKVWSGLGSSKFLAVVDPIIGIKFGQLLLLVGLAEIVIALVCFFSKRQTLALGLVAWMSTNFVVYRLGLWWTNWKRPCGCLGNLTEALHISPEIADNIMKVLLAYLLLGSYGLLVVGLCGKGRRRSGSALQHQPTPLILLCGAIVVAANSTPCAAVEFQVEGTIKRFVYNRKQDGSLQSSELTDFQVCVSNNQWSVTTFEEHGNYRFVSGCDGMDCFYIVLDADQQPLSGSTDVVRPAVVTPGIYPEYIYPQAAVAWLAFASEDFFSAAALPLLPAPWASPMDDPSSLIYDFSAAYLSDTFLVPSRISWFVSEKKKRDLLNGDPIRNYAPEILAALKFYDAGITGGVFRVTSTTNVFGLTLPLEFELVRNFVPGTGVVERYVGRVAKFESHACGVGKPAIKEKLGVSDYRWNHPKLGLLWLNYPVTNGLWPDRNNPSLQAMFNERRAGYPAAPIVTKGKRALVLWVLVLLMAFPLAWLLLTRLRGGSTRS
jgi:hypothetical protein